MNSIFSGILKSTRDLERTVPTPYSPSLSSLSRLSHFSREVHLSYPCCAISGSGIAYRKKKRNEQKGNMRRGQTNSFAPPPFAVPNLAILQQNRQINEQTAGRTNRQHQATHLSRSVHHILQIKPTQSNMPPSRLPPQPPPLQPPLEAAASGARTSPLLSPTLPLSTPPLPAPTPPPTIPPPKL